MRLIKIAAALTTLLTPLAAFGQAQVVSSPVVSTSALNGVLTAPLGAGNCTTDDTLAVSKAAASGYVLLPAGKCYLITSNLALGTIISQGGSISANSGVVATYTDVVGNPAQVVFQGAGTFNNLRNSISVGWYAGSEMGVKWSFATRGFQTSIKKNTLIPCPMTTDPAYTLDHNGAPAWKVATPIIFDDPTDNEVVTQQCSFVAQTYLMPEVIQISPVNKSEDVYYTGLAIDGNNKSINGIYAQGGARFHFLGHSWVVYNVGKGVFWDNSLWPADEVYFQFLEATGNGDTQLYFGGTAGNTNAGGKIDYLFTNGARAVYGPGVVSGGALTSVSLAATGPWGGAQMLAGWCYSAQVIHLYSMPGGTGYGATGTPTCDANGNILSVAITAGGAGFTNGETIMMSSVNAVFQIEGPTRGLTIGKVFDNEIPSLNGLAPVWDALGILETNSAGSTQDAEIGNIYSFTNARPIFVARAGTGGTGSSHIFLLHDIPTMQTPIDATRSAIEIAYTARAKVDLSGTAFGGSSQMIKVDPTTASNIDFLGQVRSLTVGNPPSSRFNGAPVYYDSTGLASNTAISMAIKVSSAALPASIISLGGPTANAYYVGYISDNGVLIDIAKGSLVDSLQNTVLTGTTGGSGRVTVSVSNGTVYLENRTASVLPYKLSAGQ